MGGYGSGPYGHMGSKTAKTATGRCQFLDIRQLRREWDMQPGRSRSWSWTTNGKPSGTIMIRSVSVNEIVLEYKSTINGQTQQVEESIFFTESNCNYGGVRRWLSCPGCHKRIAVLYLKGTHFRCRHCHNLNYYSSQECGNLPDQTERRVNRILLKLKNQKQYGFDVMYCRPTRPKGMHWNTWCRMRKQFDEAQLEYIQAVEKKMSSFRAVM